MRTKSKRRQLLACMLSFVLITVYAQSVFGFSLFKKAETPEIVPPAMKMYSKHKPVEINISSQNLNVVNGSIEEAKKLYDGDSETAFVGEESADVTLDLGKKHVLAGVKFTPVGEEKSLNNAIGTKFYVSKDNRVFTEAVVAEPESGENYTEDAKELMFGSVGEFRYVKAGIPKGARISEIEWLEYPKWSYSNKGVDMNLCAFDVQEDLNTDIVTAVYNSNGVMKAISKTDYEFSAENQADVSLNVKGVRSESGDSSRVAVWTDKGMLAVERILKFRYADIVNSFSVANVFSDDMMAQRNKPFVVWGKAPSESEIIVTMFDDRGQKNVKTVKVKKDGQWEVDMGSFSEGGKYILTVKCDDDEKVYKNITFGDVWLLAGQSNMEYYMLCGNDTSRYLRSKEGRTEADNPQIRLLNLLNKGVKGAGEPINNLPVRDGEKLWTYMNRDAANYCSAIGYYFAQEIQQTYNIPIGLISVAVGDTEINKWLPKDFKNGEFTGTDGALYNNRISPISKLNICGILWYQGEADDYRTNMGTQEYCDAMVGLVEHYRSIWGEDLPFYWTQLTRHAQKDASKIRNAQRLAYEKLNNKKNAGVISLMDIYGDYESEAGSCRNDIHPYQKKEAAERFAKYAMRDVYGKDTIVSGPVFAGAKFKDDAVEVSFDCTGKLAIMPKEQYADKTGDKLIRQNKLSTTKLQEFEIAGEDMIFVSADGIIDGNKVILRNNKVAKPMYVRYAWGGYPEMPNLTDESGLPALSFSTLILD